MNLGTDLQTTFDSFFAKIPSHDFTSEETLVYQLFKTSVSYAQISSDENLQYVYDEILYTGNFINIVSQNSIELISLYMVREYYRRVVSKFEATKQYLGTKDFNKSPDVKTTFDITYSLYKSSCDEVEKFKLEFYHYNG